MREISQLKGEKTCRLFTMKGDCTGDQAQAFLIFDSEQLNKSFCFGLKTNMFIFRFIAENRGNGRESSVSILLAVCGKLGEEVLLS